MHHSGSELVNPFKVLERVGIQPGWHVADFGCGALGHFVFPAAQLVRGDGKVYAVDIQKVALARVEKIAKLEQYWNVYPVWSDIDVYGATRVPPESLDLVIIANNYYLSQNREGMLKEAMRLLKMGGKILLIEWKKERTPLGPAYENRLSSEEVSAEITFHDLHPIDAFDAGDCHYGLVYRYRHEQAPEIEVMHMSEPLHSLAADG
jgi:ubiquinone/menaquinone biosynthesis C-methylase UbiE